MEAKNGLEGFEMAYKHIPDLIISSGLMPKMDGFELLRKIKSSSALGHIPFILNSDFYSSNKHKDFALSLGADAFCIKQIELGELWDKILYIKTKVKHEKDISALTDNDFLLQHNRILLEKLLNSQSMIDFRQKQCINLYHSMRDAIIVSDTNRLIINANQPATKEIFGYDTDEIIGKSARILFADDEGFHYTGREVYDFKEYIKGRILQVNYKRKNGQIFPAEVYAMKLIDESGSVIGNLGVIRDISKRKETEETLKNLNNQFTALLNALPDRITLISPEWKLLWANDFSLKYLNKEKENVVGRLCYEVWHNRTEPCKICAVRESFQSGNPAMIHLTTPDKKFWEVRAFPLKDNKGIVNGVISISRDITEQKKLEEHLRQSQKMEAVGQLAGGIAHDFNNILTAMVVYGGLIQMKTKEDDPLRHYANLILSLSEKATKLTQGLLAFSRKQIMNMQPVNINELIKNFEKILSRLLREDIELKTFLSNDILVSEVDPAQIEHVLMNLATNASDAMPNGGILTISTDLVDIDAEYAQVHGYGKPGRYILISVEDTGIGMDEYTRERIFEPFFTTKDMGRGTGLGLSIVYGTIKQHNGYINVYSEPNSGTTFKIYLPVAEGTTLKNDYSMSETIKGGSASILLAEDNEEVRQGIKAFLENYGYKVTEAVDGEDAIEKFKQNKEEIDLLIIDVIMPRKNGKEAYQEMLTIKPSLKALFISGYTANIIHKKGILDKGINFIPKPVSPNEMLKKISVILDLDED